jgi:hypothetical protein
MKFPKTTLVAGSLLFVLTARIAAQSRHIQPRHGRWITKENQTYCRWCFADLGTACDFIEQFDGGYLGKPRQIKQKKLGK